MDGVGECILDIAFRLLFWYNRILYADLDERHRADQPGTLVMIWRVSTAAFFVWSQLFSSVTANNAAIVPVQYVYEHLWSGKHGNREERWLRGGDRYYPVPLRCTGIYDLQRAGHR